MQVDQVQLELKRLRRGRGVASADVDKRVGPLLRRWCGAPVGSTAVRAALAQHLQRCIERLPTDAATTARVAFGLPFPQVKEIAAELVDLAHGEFAVPSARPGRELVAKLTAVLWARLGLTESPATFTERVVWLADRMQVASRTAVRRVGEAEVLLAQQIAGELSVMRPGGGEGWHDELVEVTVKLDSSPPMVLITRTIVVGQEDLGAIEFAYDIPSAVDSEPGEQVQAEALFGARLVDHRPPSPIRGYLDIAFPRRLGPGDRHVFGLMLRPVRLRPRYVNVAHRRCDRLDVRVRFDVADPPWWVRRVDGESLRVLDEARAPTVGAGLALDASGEVQASFIRPALEVAYGLQWESQTGLRAPEGSRS